MTTRALIVTTIILATSTGLYLSQNRTLPNNDPTSLLSDITRPIFTPDPLRMESTKTSTQSLLTAEGVFKATNDQRAAAGLPTLAGNATLNQAAENKLEDMFAQQYFEHKNPQGKGPSDVVEAVSYDYLAVGENLALGDFASDTALVQAWMDSPGHRANILGKSFTQLGVAVGRGQFDGDLTWLAVQTFATPDSACQKPDSRLKTTIDNQINQLTTIDSLTTNQNDEITNLTNQASNLAQEIKALQKEAAQKIAAGNTKIQQGNEASKRGDQETAEDYWAAGRQLQEEGQLIQAESQSLQTEYSELIAESNTLRETYNTAIQGSQPQRQQLEAIITNYNQQVNAFNACAANFTSQ